MIEVNMKPEDIDELVRQTILKSGIGTAIEKAIRESLGGYNSPVNEAVKRVVVETLYAMLHEEPWREQIKTAVRTALEAHVSKETLEAIANASISKIERAAADRY